MVLYKEFKVGDLLTVSGTKSSNKGDLVFTEDGINFVGRTSDGNGIQGTVSPMKHEPNEGNTITISQVGTIVAKYQPEPYYTSQNIAKLENDNINRSIGLYMASVINRALIMYEGYNTPKLSDIKEITLKLPVKNLEDNEPDWEYMEEYIKQKELAYIGKLNKEFKQKKEQLIELIGEESEYINIEELPTAKFKVGDLMDIVGSKKSIHKNMITRLDGEKPYVTRTEKNNGISEYIEFEDKYLNEGNTISLGLDTYVVNYQEKPYYTGNKIKVIKYEGINKINALYIVGVLRKVFSEYKWGMGINQKQLENLEIELPVKVEGINEPDWETMEKYIARVELQLLNRITNTLNK